MPVQMKLLAAVLMFTLGVLTGWVLTANHYKAVIAETAKEQADNDRDNQKQRADLVTTNAELNQKLGAQHDTNQSRVVYIHDHPAGGVSLPSCKTVPPSGTADPSGSGQTQTAPSGILPDANQLALDRFTKRLDDLQYQADTDIEACRTVMDWVNAHDTVP